MKVLTKRSTLSVQVRPATFTAALNRGVPQPQPSSGEILCNAQIQSPNESREPINDAAIVNTPHLKHIVHSTRSV